MTGHGHSHAPSARAGARHRGRLKAALVLVVGGTSNGGNNYLASAELYP